MHLLVDRIGCTLRRELLRDLPAHEVVKDVRETFLIVLIFLTVFSIANDSA